MVLFCVTLTAQKSTGRYNPKGTWKFENTAAPPGYSTGVVEIKHVKKQYSVTFSFADNGETYKAEDVTFKKDSLQFSLTVQGMAMACKSKFEGADKIAGETYVMGTSVPFLLTRERKK
jgi:hypothetical protein